MSGTTNTLQTREPAVLVLEDGRTFAGHAYGSRGETLGEAVGRTPVSLGGPRVGIVPEQRNLGEGP